MLSVLDFGFNLLLIIAYIAVVSFVFCLNLLKRQTFGIPLIGLFSFYLLDTVVINMTEVIPEFGRWYDQVFLLSPTIKTVIYIGIAFFTLYTWNTWTGRSFSRLQGVSLILLSLWYLFIPMGQGGAMKSWLYFIAYQVFSIVMSLFALRQFKRHKGNCMMSEREVWLLLILTIVWSLFIMAEDFFVIFRVDVYSGTVTRIRDRNLCEDSLRLLYTALLTNGLLRRLKDKEPQMAGVGAVALAGSSAGKNQMTEQAAAEVCEEVPSEPDEQMLQFAQQLCLTEREREVLRLMLQNRTNQQIGETLYISIGTVKAHIHNIFQKAGVTRRYELMRLYETHCRKLAT